MKPLMVFRDIVTGTGAQTISKTFNEEIDILGISTGSDQDYAQEINVAIYPGQEAETITEISLISGWHKTKQSPSWFGLIKNFRGLIKMFVTHDAAADKASLRILYRRSS